MSQSGCGVGLRKLHPNCTLLVISFGATRSAEICDFHIGQTKKDGFSRQDRKVHWESYLH
jgi:hypothetical protein